MYYSFNKTLEISLKNVSVLKKNHKIQIKPFSAFLVIHFPSNTVVIFYIIFDNCIPKSRQMLFTLLHRHILKIHKKIKSNNFLQTPPDSCFASPQVPLR